MFSWAKALYAIAKFFSWLGPKLEEWTTKATAKRRLDRKDRDVDAAIDGVRVGTPGEQPKADRSA